MLRDRLKQLEIVVLLASEHRSAKFFGLVRISNW